MNGELPEQLEPLGDPTESVLDPRYPYLQAAADNRQHLIDQLNTSDVTVKARLGELQLAKDAAAAKANDLKDRQAEAQAAVDEQHAIEAASMST